MEAIARQLPAASTPLSQSEAGRAFLQRRVAAFGLMGGGLGGLFLVLRQLLALAGRTDIGWSDPSMLFHFLGAASLWAAWLTCRGAPRSLGFIRAVEAAGVLGAAVGYSAMGTAMPAAARADYVILLALALGLLARAIYVPSSARRTLLLSLVAAAPALAVDYWIFSTLDLETWSVIYARLDDTNPHSLAAMAMGIQAAWWLSVIFICTAASKVIYGLRSDARSGRKLGQYTLHAKLGEGGMGQVFLATHAMLRRPTAVKLFSAEKTGRYALAQFEREVRQTARLNHPNTVTVFDFGRTPEGTFYYAMELIEGATLGDVVGLAGPQEPARVIHILSHAASALAEAHSAGLVHRDINPANIMLCERGGIHDTVKVLDFGLVEELEAESGETSMTDVNRIIGTPHYMSPEAIAGPDGLDGRSDIYALGAVGYFLLTGQHVFEGSSVADVCASHLYSTPVAPSERVDKPIPLDLETLIMMCLDKDPAARPQSAVALCDALRGCREAGTWTAEKARTWWAHHGQAIRDRRGHRIPAASVASGGASTTVAGTSSAAVSGLVPPPPTQRRTEGADTPIGELAGAGTCIALS